MSYEVVVEKDAKDKAVKTKKKVCPFLLTDCVGEVCHVWDKKYDRCQIENLSLILDNLIAVRLKLEAN